MKMTIDGVISNPPFSGTYRNVSYSGRELWKDIRSSGAKIIFPFVMAAIIGVTAACGTPPPIQCANPPKFEEVEEYKLIEGGGWSFFYEIAVGENCKVGEIRENGSWTTQFVITADGRPMGRLKSDKIYDGEDTLVATTQSNFWGTETKILNPLGELIGIIKTADNGYDLIIGDKQEKISVGKVYSTHDWKTTYAVTNNSAVNNATIALLIVYLDYAARS